ncbi:MAG: hypothetical protein KDK90_07585 [Leptospiraceae bacterium]|nr:hypothetical protein [Leptospiraceae bacterium]
MEMVVVMMILGVLITMTAVSISNFIKPPPKEITDNIKAALFYAYQTAILNNQTVMFVLNRADNKYLVVKIDRTDEGLEEKKMLESSLPSNLSIVDVMDLRGIKYESEKIEIPFNRDGISENYDIHLGREGNIIYTIMIYKFNGRIEIVPGEKSRAEELNYDKNDEKKKQEELEILFE